MTSTGADSGTTVPPHVASGDLARKRCGSTTKPTPDGFYTCTAEVGHDGPHAAYSSAGHLCDTWPRDEAADRAAALAGTGLVVPSGQTAVMASPDYQAWAAEGEPSESAPKQSPFAELLGRELSSDQIGAIRHIVLAGQDVYHVASGTWDEFWYDAGDTAHELHLAWCVAVERETGRWPGEPR